MERESPRERWEEALQKGSTTKVTIVLEKIKFWIEIETRPKIEIIEN